jgi:hypothetical protein
LAGSGVGGGSGVSGGAASSPERGAAPALEALGRVAGGDAFGAPHDDGEFELFMQQDERIAGGVDEEAVRAAAWGA